MVTSSGIGLSLVQRQGITWSSYQQYYFDHEEKFLFEAKKK